MAEKRKRGRPKKDPLVDPHVADALVEWLSEGKTLREFCRQEGMPSRQTIDRWRQEDEEFSGRVARARDTGFEQMADQCVEIADSAEDPALGRLRVDTRLKLLACWDPKRYGNKVAVESKSDIKHSGQVRTGPPVPDPEEFRRYVKNLAKELDDE